MARVELELVEIKGDEIYIRHSSHTKPWAARGPGLAELRDLAVGTFVVADVDLYTGQVEQVFEVLGNWARLEEAVELAAKADWSRLLRRLSHDFVTGDPALLAFRVRAAQELDRVEDAERDFCRILELAPQRRTRAIPPPLSELYATFSPEAAERMIPAIVEAVRLARLPLDGEDTHRLMSLVPERAWSNGYLCQRARVEMSSRMLQVVLREMERRLAENPLPHERIRLERVLAQVKEKPAERAHEARAHPIYRSAVAGVKPMVPPGPPHLGGPMPELRSMELRPLARWAVERLLEKVETEAQALLERVTQIEAAAGHGLTAAVRAVVREISEMLKEIGEGVWFVAALDQELMRLEAAAMLRRAKRPVPPSFIVLARGADPRGKPAAWLLRANEAHVFLARVGKSWIYESGEPDLVIASVPDRWFDLVANALG